MNVWGCIYLLSQFNWFRTPFQFRRNFLIGFLAPLTHGPDVNSPTLSTQRIESLDLIRGFAVCGLIAINGIEFGFGSIPLIYPLDFSEGERGLWAMVMGLGAGKFATLFSALFGAGLLLFCGRVEASGRSAASVYLPRLGWLLVFGMLHAYLLWHGDILVTYAVAGFVLFWCRNWSAKIFAILGGVLFGTMVIPMILGAVVSHFIDFEPFAENFEGIADAMRKEDANEAEAMAGSWSDQMRMRAIYAFFIQVLGIPFYLFWFAAMNMCLGMALFKSGFFSGGWPVERLRKVTFSVLGIGLLLTLGGYGVFAFADPEVLPLMWAYTSLLAGLPLVAFGYAGVGVMWSKREVFGWLKKGFTAIGRMAFTNYIAHSVILGFIYYGHGLSLRGQLNFYEAMLLVPTIALAQMLVSLWWLKRFRFGPLEWLWRRLTYGSSAVRGRPTPPKLPVSE